VFFINHPVKLSDIAKRSNAKSVGQHLKGKKYHGCTHYFLKLSTSNDMQNASDFEYDFSAARATTLKSDYWFDKIHLKNNTKVTDKYIGDTLLADTHEWFVNVDPEGPEKENTGSGNWFQAFLIPPCTGAYTFGIDSDDAGDFLIDDVVVASWYGSHGMSGDVSAHSGIIDLTRNTVYKLDCRVSDHGGEIDGIALGWKIPGNSSWAAVPPDVLVPRTTFGQGYGESPDRPAFSALDIKSHNPDAGNGVYYIFMDVHGPTPVYCVMDEAYDGGGWMLAMKATTGTTFQFDSPYWTYNNTLNPESANQSNGDAKFQVFNCFRGRDLLARWPDIGEGGSISGVGSWTWLQNGYPSFIDSPKCTLLHLFRSADRSFIQDAKTYSGYGSAFSSQKDVRFYVFNWVASGNSACASRWGFGWNENGGGLFPNGQEGSPDVSGGIGLKHRNGFSASAGDRSFGGYHDSLGIDRRARVELYVR
jgi:hypothetical protein